MSAYRARRAGDQSGLGEPQYTPPEIAARPANVGFVARVQIMLAQIHVTTRPALKWVMWLGVLALMAAIASLFLSIRQEVKEDAPGIAPRVLLPGNGSLSLFESPFGGGPHITVALGLTNLTIDPGPNGVTLGPEGFIVFRIPGGTSIRDAAGTVGPVGNLTFLNLLIDQTLTLTQFGPSPGDLRLGLNTSLLPVDTNVYIVDGALTGRRQINLNDYSFSWVEGTNGLRLQALRTDNFPGLFAALGNNGGMAFDYPFHGTGDIVFVIDTAAPANSFVVANEDDELLLQVRGSDGFLKLPQYGDGTFLAPNVTDLTYLLSVDDEGNVWELDLETLLSFFALTAFDENSPLDGMRRRFAALTGWNKINCLGNGVNCFYTGTPGSATLNINVTVPAPSSSALPGVVINGVLYTNLTLLGPAGVLTPGPGPGDGLLDLLLLLQNATFAPTSGGDHGPLTGGSVNVTTGVLTLIQGNGTVDIPLQQWIDLVARITNVTLVGPAYENIQITEGGVAWILQIFSLLQQNVITQNMVTGGYYNATTNQIILTQPLTGGTVAITLGSTGTPLNGQITATYLNLTGNTLTLFQGNYSIDIDISELRENITNELITAFAFTPGSNEIYIREAGVVWPLDMVAWARSNPTFNATLTGVFFNISSGSLVFSRGLSVDNSTVVVPLQSWIDQVARITNVTLVGPAFENIELTEGGVAWQLQIFSLLQQNLITQNMITGGYFNATANQLVLTQPLTGATVIIPLGDPENPFNELLTAYYLNLTSSSLTLFQGNYSLNIDLSGFRENVTNELITAFAFTPGSDEIYTREAGVVWPLDLLAWARANPSFNRTFTGVYFNVSSGQLVFSQGLSNNNSTVVVDIGPYIDQNARITNVSLVGPAYENIQLTEGGVAWLLQIFSLLQQNVITQNMVTGGYYNATSNQLVLTQPLTGNTVVIPLGDAENPFNELLTGSSLNLTTGALALFQGNYSLNIDLSGLRENVTNELITAFAFTPGSDEIYIKEAGAVWPLDLVDWAQANPTFNSTLTGAVFNYSSGTFVFPRGLSGDNSSVVVPLLPWIDQVARITNVSLVGPAYENIELTEGGIAWFLEIFSLLQQNLITQKMVTDASFNQTSYLFSFYQGLIDDYIYVDLSGMAENPFNELVTGFAVNLTAQTLTMFQGQAPNNISIVIDMRGLGGNATDELITFSSLNTTTGLLNVYQGSYLHTVDLSALLHRPITGSQDIMGLLTGDIRGLTWSDFFNITVTGPGQLRIDRADFAITCNHALIQMASDYAQAVTTAPQPVMWQFIKHVKVPTAFQWDGNSTVHITAPDIYSVCYSFSLLYDSSGVDNDALVTFRLYADNTQISLARTYPFGGPINSTNNVHIQSGTWKCEFVEITNGGNKTIHLTAEVNKPTGAIYLDPQYLTYLTIESVNDLCEEAPLNTDTFAPSAVPTAVPTTATPTATPTVSPTRVPTGTPTTLPSASPTAGPSASPTAGPTAGPTDAPTAGPSASPTAGPTTSPTFAPTAGPTVAPSGAPTAGPTAGPTTSPTVAPTFAPTVSPTAGPTFVPTVAPTATPTVAPTPVPTAAPTGIPTATPTFSSLVFRCNGSLIGNGFYQTVDFQLPHCPVDAGGGTLFVPDQNVAVADEGAQITANVLFFNFIGPTIQSTADGEYVNVTVLALIGKNQGTTVVATVLSINCVYPTVCSDAGSGQMNITSADTGEANVGANVGDNGIGVYIGKSGVTLQFRKLHSPLGTIDIGVGDGGEIELDVTLAHNELSGLADDDHLQYALLAGRAGGQFLNGGTGTGDDLILQGTASGNTGIINVTLSDLYINEEGKGIYVQGSSFLGQIRLYYGPNGFSLSQTGVGGNLNFMENANNPQILAGSPTMTGSFYMDARNGAEMALNTLAGGAVRMTNNHMLPETAGVPNIGSTTEPFNRGFFDDGIQLHDQTAPANPGSAKGVLYKLAGDDGIWWKPDASGAAVDLTDGFDIQEDGTLIQVNTQVLNFGTGITAVVTGPNTTAVNLDVPSLPDDANPTTGYSFPAWDGVSAHKEVALAALQALFDTNITGASTVTGLVEADIRGLLFSDFFNITTSPTGVLRIEPYPTRQDCHSPMIMVITQLSQAVTTTETPITFEVTRYTTPSVSYYSFNNISTLTILQPGVYEVCYQFNLEYDASAITSDATVIVSLYRDGVLTDVTHSIPFGDIDGFPSHRAQSGSYTCDIITATGTNTTLQLRSRTDIATGAIFLHNEHETQLKVTKVDPVCTTVRADTPTPSPTVINTHSPTTGTPTASPTAIPTGAPSAVPTAVPSAAPSAAPTAGPTTSPTVAPTFAPTAGPSTSPTFAPTRAPTAGPTTSPTVAPTFAPTVSPTAGPTFAPTRAPTASPSISPTASPTAAPTPLLVGADEGTTVVSNVNRLNCVGASFACSQGITGEFVLNMTGYDSPIVASQSMGRLWGSSDTPTLVASTLGVYVKFEMTGMELDTESSSDFDQPVNGRLRYTGSFAQKFEINVVCSVSADDDQAGRAAVYINGVILDKCTLRVRWEDIDEYEEYSINCLRTLQPNDYIEVWGTTYSTGGLTTFDHEVFSLMITVMSLESPRGAQGPAGSGSTLTFQNSGVPVTSTPHSTVNLISNRLVFANAGSGVVTLTESSRPYGYIYYTAASGTAGTFVTGSGAAPSVVNPVTTLDLSSSFDMPSNGRLRYNGTLTTIFDVAASVYGAVNSANRQGRYQIFRDGTGLAGCNSYPLNNDDGNSRATEAIQCPVQLATNQYLELYAHNIANAELVEVTNLRISARAL